MPEPIRRERVVVDPRLAIATAVVDPRAPLVEVRGEIDLATAALLDRGLRRVERPGARLTVDFAEVSFMDLIGLRVVMAAGRRMRRAGGALELARPVGQVRRLIELLGLAERLSPVDAPTN